MEYCMLGIPSVATNHTPYRQWRDENPDTVMLAESKIEWYAGLKILATHQSTRQRMGSNGALYVSTKHTIGSTAGQWEAALRSVGATLVDSDTETVLQSAA